MERGALVVVVVLLLCSLSGCLKHRQWAGSHELEVLHGAGSQATL